MPAKTPRTPTPRTKTVDLTVLWTARALQHTDTLRWFLHADMDESSPLEAIGVRGVTPSTSLTRAKEKLRARLAALEAATVCRDAALFRNVDALGAMLSLSDTERDLLAFAITLDYHRPLLACFERLEGLSLRRLHALLGAVLGRPEEAVRDALRRTAPLSQTGLVRVAADVRRTWDDPFEVMDGLENILLGEYERPESILGNFFREAPAPRLTLDEFPHAKDDVELLRRFLTGALAGPVAGVNVLLYGLPGTGKTELARTVAKAVGAQLYEVNVESDDGAAIAGSGRFGAYQLCQRMLARRTGALVLFDEIEDVFPDRYFPFFGRQKRSGDDKGWTNRLLEGNPVPTLWLSNEIGQMDPAFLRRFDCILELRTPPLAVRRRILEKSLEGLPVRAPWLSSMATDERLTPAHIERAARVARLSGFEGADEVEHAVSRILHNALAVQAPAGAAAPSASDTYDLRFLNCSEDLVGIVSSLERRARETRGALTGSICLYGPPGTGKTAFAHHLAERLCHGVGSFQIGQLRILRCPLVDPPLDQHHFMRSEILLALGRHMLVVVLRQVHADDDVAVVHLAVDDSVAFLAALHKQVVFVHPVLALLLVCVVARVALLFENRDDDVGVNHLLGRRFGVRSGLGSTAILAALLFLDWQPNQLPDLVRRVFRQIILTVGQGSPVVTGVSHHSRTPEQEQPEEPGPASVGDIDPDLDHEGGNRAAGEDDAAIQVTLRQFLPVVPGHAVVENEAKQHRDHGGSGGKEHRDLGRASGLPLRKKPPGFQGQHQKQHTDWQMEQHRVEAADELRHVRQALLRRWTRPERQDCQRGDDDQPDQGQEYGAFQGSAG